MDLPCFKFYRYAHTFKPSIMNLVKILSKETRISFFIILKEKFNFTLPSKLWGQV